MPADKSGGRGLKDATEDTFNNLSDAELVHITTLAEEGTDNKDTAMDKIWITQYNRLVECKLKNGKLSTYKGLRQWIAKQHRQFQDGIIDERRVSRLKDVGLFSAEEVQTYKRRKRGSRGSNNLSEAEKPVPITTLVVEGTSGKDTALDKQWIKQYNRLVEYKLEHGNCVINATRRDLQQWIVKQRRQLRDGLIDERRVARLKNIGLFSVEEVQEYNRKKGGHALNTAANLNNCARETDDNKLIPDHLSKAQAASALTALAERGTRTKKVSVHEEKWFSQYNKLVAHKLEHGNFDIFSSDRKLYKWLESQRIQFKSGCMSEQRVARLKDIGLFSDEEVQNYKNTKNESAYEIKMQANWESRFKDLCTYKLKHGTCNVSGTQDLLLQRWVTFQRREFKQGNMSLERIAKLNEIGMLTEQKPPRPTKTPKIPKSVLRWDAFFGQLAAFKLEHGDCNIRYKGKPKLTQWAQRQVSDWREGKLSEERVAKLTGVGLLTDDKKVKHDPEVTWNLRYNELLE
jgi:phage antirepressor YoqD-like protein